MSMALTLGIAGACFAGCQTANSNNQATGNETQAQTTQNQDIDYSTLSEEELQALYEKEPASKRTIHVAYDGGLCVAPIPAAQYEGFFEAEGLNTDLVASADARDALAAGKIDTAVGMLADWLTSIQNGVELRFTTAIHTGCTSAAVLADSDITKLEKGQKVGVGGAIGGYTHNIALRFASHDGYTATDFDWLAIDPSALLTALQKGDVQVIVGGDQLIRKWEADGLVKIIRSQTTDDDFKDEACCAFGFPKEFIEENPVTAYKLTRAIYKAGLWINESKENREKLISECLENGNISGDPEYNLKVLESLRYGLEYSDLEKSLDDMVKEFVDLGILKQDLDQETFKQGILINYHLDKLKQ